MQTIAQDLNGTTLEALWPGITYLLCVVVTQPVYTTVSDVFGRKPPLYAAFFLFIAGSLLFALAKTMAMVNAGRILQGLGGGGLDLLGEVIVADMTTLQERSLYIGLLALPIAVGSILGPTLGALFSGFASWRWIGWINLPLLGLAFFLVFFFLHLRPVETPFHTNVKRLDYGGIVLSVVGQTAFSLSLSWAGSLYAWGDWQTLLPLIIGAFVLVAFVFYEARPALAAPIVPHRLFGSRTARWTLVGNFVEGAVLFAVLQYLPLFFQAIELQTVIGSAVTLLPTSIISVVAAAGVVIVVGIIGKGYLWTVRFSWALLTTGTGLLALLNPGSSRSAHMGIPVLWGAGVGALMRLLHLPMQASAPMVDDTGLVIGLMLLVRLMGGLIGMAVGSTIFASVFGTAISRLDGSSLPGQLAVLKDATEAISFIPRLRELDVSPSVLEPVIGVYLEALRAIFYAMTGLSGLGLLSSFFTEELSLDNKELGRQQFEEK